MTSSASSLRVPAIAAIASLTLLGFLVATQTPLLGAVNQAKAAQHQASSMKSAASSKAASLKPVLPDTIEGRKSSASAAASASKAAFSSSIAASRSAASAAKSSAGR